MEVIMNRIIKYYNIFLQFLRNAVELINDQIKKRIYNLKEVDFKNIDRINQCYYTEIKFKKEVKLKKKDREVLQKMKEVLLKLREIIKTENKNGEILEKIELLKEEYLI